MRVFALTTAASVLSLVAAQQPIMVNVGNNMSLTFEPSSVTANAGDTVVFTFLSKNHSVTQSTFADPCQIMTSPMQGLDSSFQNVAAGASQVPQYSITVTNSSTPLWFFCAQTNPVHHCSQGMVFAVNAPTTGPKTFQAFQAAAMANSTAPPSPSGALMTRASGAGVLAAVGALAGLLL